jgi:hypothetical protein
MFSQILPVLDYTFKYFFYSFFIPVFTTHKNYFLLLQNCHKIFYKICTFLFLQF